MKLKFIDAVVYIKGREKRTWNLLLNDERERMYIETLDAVYDRTHGIFI